MRPLMALAVVAAVCALSVADEPALTITDSSGKEVSVKRWKIIGGTRKLSWIDGNPDAFVMRELGSTTFKDGIATLIPLSRIESIVWDYPAQTMTVKVIGVEKPLVGSTKYKDINVLTIEVEVDQGDAGVAAVRFRGGVIKGGFRGVKFPSAKAPMDAKDAGPSFTFTIPPEGKSKGAPAVHTVTGMQALYRLGPDNEIRLPYLMFKKTLKVELADVVSLSVGKYSIKDQTAECELKRKDGSELSVTLLTAIQIDGKPATFEGFIGNVSAGYRLFPIHTFSQWAAVEKKR